MWHYYDPQIDEKPDKSELLHGRPGVLPQAPHHGGGHDKKPWLHPMVPTPLLPLPTLSFTVSQVSDGEN